MNATVKDLMTTEVVAVRRDTTFKELAAALRRYRVSALPVVDDAGRVTRRRLRGRPAGQGGAGRPRRCSPSWCTTRTFARQRA